MAAQLVSQQSKSSSGERTRLLNSMQYATDFVQYRKYFTVTPILSIKQYQIYLKIGLFDK